ncbi:hypothetical protein CO2235_30041 [Cupriavidus oxalaticus]|uniref:Uncharacterized protein n=1 Tax=Cupriavidus oxalaticus TaxID=96344 RepID=A0A375G761_9BURK|nr:hypothetical protein CO2235_30041 [Cupriavidus oxalaticus]
MPQIDYLSSVSHFDSRGEKKPKLV